MGWTLIDEKGKFIRKLNPKYGKWVIEHKTYNRNDIGLMTKDSKRYSTYRCPTTTWNGFFKPKFIDYSRIVCSDAFNQNLTGNYYTSNFQFIKLTLKACVNNKKRKKCAS